MSENNQRIGGLDALRFLAAMWVVFGHCGCFPLTEGIDRDSVVGKLVHGVYGNLFAAVPAVIVFFVISGLCIHFPYYQSGRFELRSYIARRYLRICVPLFVAMLVARQFDVNLRLFHNSVLWTLLAELIYYSLYPVLRIVRSYFGWGWIIGVSYVLAYGAVLACPDALDYSPFGPALNWLVAFPCWLIGCALAEADLRSLNRDVSSAYLWSWRLGIWFLSSLCSVLRFHAGLGYPWTLNVFAIPVAFWLLVEIRAHKDVRGGALESMGRWSYSIYLTHMIANDVFGMLPTPNLGFNLNWVQRMLFILSCAYLFYLVVERPSHLIARRVAALLKAKSESEPLSPIAASVSQ